MVDQLDGSAFVLSEQRKKYLARQRRYNRSEKGRARDKRYEDSVIRVPAYNGGTFAFGPRMILPRTPENEAWLDTVYERRDEFRARMASERAEFAELLAQE